ncbi:hypothetical protein E2562_013687 [Oryza meyeriana var. granulata]|uniref:Thaumatin-like protein n=1 Tax=Oryza meyeriana var. granulata TaxID=110450 RepID=A0A6G1BK49_9ORYZ|nr:hypothetical protein E2562_013687 [Oryza meyeriana var. granulata]
MAMAKQLALAFVLGIVAAASTAVTATKLTLHNLCPYPVWPLVTPNTGFPFISDNTVRLDGGGRGLVSYNFPASFWAGRVVARTGCTGGLSRCETGNAPPATAIGGRQCPALGCTADLNDRCLRSQCMFGVGGAVVACRGTVGYFKERCPLMRTTGSDVEPVPHRCPLPHPNK